MLHSIFSWFQGDQVLCGSWSLKEGLTLWDYNYRKLIKNIPIDHHLAQDNNDGESRRVFASKFTLLCASET